jgi:hypothetical protein
VILVKQEGVQVTLIRMSSSVYGIDP